MASTVKLTAGSPRPNREIIHSQAQQLQPVAHHERVCATQKVPNPALRNVQQHPSHSSCSYCVQKGGEAPVHDPHRFTGPELTHLAPRSGWGSDPHGPIYYKGRYHLFYQACHASCQWWWKRESYASGSHLKRHIEEGPTPTARSLQSLPFEPDVPLDGCWYHAHDHESMCFFVSIELLMHHEFVHASTLTT
eukprot:1145909-Pelagomonas_calceolata.AAC.2